MCCIKLLEVKTLASELLTKWMAIFKESEFLTVTIQELVL